MLFTPWACHVDNHPKLGSNYILVAGVNNKLYRVVLALRMKIMAHHNNDQALNSILVILNARTSLLFIFDITDIIQVRHYLSPQYDISARGSICLGLTYWGNLNFINVLLRKNQSITCSTKILPYVLAFFKYNCK